MASFVPVAKMATGTIRKLWPTERETFIAHLLRLDPDTRRNRFGVGVNDSFLVQYARMTFGVGGIVFAYIEDGIVRGAAELRGLEDIIAHSGEAAFSVENDWRKRGIGAILFSRLIRAARNRRVNTLYMTCLPQNRAMQNLAAKFDAELAMDNSGVIGLLDADRPTAFTVLGEAMDDAQDFAVAALNAQRRFWQRSLRPLSVA
jgi:RimJ/RimL family protein N-acetyltransferase